MKVVSENRFSGKTYFYTIASRDRERKAQIDALTKELADLKVEYRVGLSIGREVLKVMFHQPAWAVDSYSSGPPAGGTSQNITFKSLRPIDNLTLYVGCNCTYWAEVLR